MSDAESIDGFPRRGDHRQHTPGCPQALEWKHWIQFPAQEAKRMSNRLEYCGWMDKAWTVMLYRHGLVKHEVAKRLLTGLEDAREEARNP